LMKEVRKFPTDKGWKTKIPIKNYTTDGKGGSLTGSLEMMKAVIEYKTNYRILTS